MQGINGSPGTVAERIRIAVRGNFGSGPRELATVTGIGAKNGRLVVDYQPDKASDGYGRWAYVDQIEAAWQFDSDPVAQRAAASVAKGAA